mmetsp:Transcript_17309/g.37553  ORF Transcript_17309/g.37553 Transcript_17309/m.37553 type:complete len:208 (+) Transcript_17309:136-759(+)
MERRWATGGQEFAAARQSATDQTVRTRSLQMEEQGCHRPGQRVGFGCSADQAVQVEEQGCSPSQAQDANGLSLDQQKGCLPLEGCRPGVSAQQLGLVRLHGRQEQGRLLRCIVIPTRRVRIRTIGRDWESSRTSTTWTPTASSTPTTRTPGRVLANAPTTLSLATLIRIKIVVGRRITGRGWVNGRSKTRRINGLIRESSRKHKKHN